MENETEQVIGISRADLRRRRLVQYQKFIVSVLDLSNDSEKNLYNLKNKKKNCPKHTKQAHGSTVAKLIIRHK